MEVDKTRQTLMSAIKDPENEQAWSEFYSLYSGFVRSMARKANSHMRADEVEEVVQTIFIEIAQGKLKYKKGKGKFRSLLKTVVKRRVFDRLRKRKNYEEAKNHRSPDDTRQTSTMDRLQDKDEGVDKMVEAEWGEMILERALYQVQKRVSKKQYQIFDAYAFREWPVTRVMKTLGVTENQVYTAKSRVGKIFDEECRRAEAEIDDPDIPPNGGGEDGAVSAN
jgi:RNA polymerase sigma-70 factor, ECF subfamily